MIRTCVECGADFEARSSRAQRCSDACRKRASRKAKPAPSVPTAAEAQSLVESVEVELAAQGAAGTTTGQLALILARRIGREIPLDTGTNIVAMLKELRSLMDSLNAAAGAADSGPSNPLDDLAKRRERRAAV